MIVSIEASDFSRRDRALDQLGHARRLRQGHHRGSLPHRRRSLLQARSPSTTRPTLRATGPPATTPASTKSRPSSTTATTRAAITACSSSPRHRRGSRQSRCATISPRRVSRCSAFITQTGRSRSSRFHSQDSTPFSRVARPRSTCRQTSMSLDCARSARVRHPAPKRERRFRSSEGQRRTRTGRMSAQRTSRPRGRDHNSRCSGGQARRHAVRRGHSGRAGRRRLPHRLLT